METTSADESKLTAFEPGDERLKKLDAVGCRTLRSCMQSVFEDGPKRDRRLWIGDLRMQALANYETYHNAELLQRLENCAEAEKMVTPYMYHNYVDALLSVGQKDKALEVLCTYWGGMLDEGADTFWELYNLANPKESPYGGTIVNSYCHAWSCAPAYFLRKYHA